MSSKTHKIAVITGDLVNSTELGREKVEHAFAALEDCAETQAEWHGAPLHFTRHRGDGWQVVLARPEMALRSALAFRAALRAEGSEFDSYMGIAEGEVEGEVGPDLNAETAEVFSASGLALSWTGKTSLESRLMHRTPGYQRATYILADSISREWTAVQAQTLLPFFDPSGGPTLTETAKKHEKTRQAVSKSLHASEFAALTAGMLSIETEANHD